MLSDFRAVFNVLLSAIGVGVVSLPGVFASNGWIPGFSVMLAGMVIANAALMKLNYAVVNQKPQVSSYEELGGRLFGRWGKAFTAFIVHFTIAGCSASLLILVGTVLNRLVNGNDPNGLQKFIALGAIPMLPFTWLKNLHHASYVAAVGTVAVFVLMFVVIAAGFKQFADSTDKAQTESVSSSFSLFKFIIGLSICVFSFNTANTAPTLLRDMKNPKHFRRVAFAGAALILFIYMAISISGYLGWGRDIVKYNTVIHLILNEKSGVAAAQTQASLGMLGSLCIGSVLALSYPHYVVLILPVANAFEDQISEVWKPKNSKIFSLSVRSTVWLATALCAVFVPSFKTFIELLAAFAMPFIAIILPISFYWKTKQNQNSALSVKSKASCTGLFVIAVSLFVIGGYEAISNAIKS